VARSVVRESVAWCVDGREVPARRDWHCSESATGGYDFAELYVPRNYLRFIDQGSKVQAWRSSGRPLWLGSMVQPPKIRQGVAYLKAQGPWYEAMTAFLSANYQDRRYDQWFARDSEPFSLSKNGGAYTVDTNNQISFTVAKGQHVGQFGSAGVVKWTPGTNITRLTFLQSVDGPSSGDNRPADYQLRLLTYFGPNTSVNTDEADWNVADGSTVDYTLGQDADMVQIALRRTSASSTSTDDSLSVTLTLLAVNGDAVGDTMFSSEIVRSFGARLGYDTSLGIQGSGVNALPFTWQSDPDSGRDNAAADALTYLASLDGWRVLVQEPQYPGFVGGLRYGPFGDPYIEPSRSWTVSLEREADEQLDDLQVANEVLVPWDMVPGIYQETVLHADPDPLAYTSLLRPDGSVQIVQRRMDKLADPQPNDQLARAVATAALARVSQRQVRGTITVYERIGLSGPVSHLEGHAGDLDTLRDYETATGVRPGPQQVVYVDHYEDHTDDTVTEDFDPAGMLADYANRKARRT
jgi:hypothetical protein